MQKLVLMSAVGLMALALAAPLGTAGHCNGEVTDLGGVAYLDDRGGEPWIYVESNGEAGLQSGGANLFGYPETCNHPNPDLLVY